jgi:hypothetical protein
MVVNVTAAKDITKESDGTIEVPKGNPGVVDDVKGPPDDTYQVTFTVTTESGTSQVQKWVERSLISFEDGQIGPARAFYEGSTATINTIRYPGTAADFDGHLGEPALLDNGVVEIVFSDSTGLRLKSNRAKGEIDVELF